MLCFSKINYRSNYIRKLKMNLRFSDDELKHTPYLENSGDKYLFRSSDVGDKENKCVHS